MWFGGTAKTYANWILLGEPFEENRKLYIYVKKDESSEKKKVRWYFDKPHDDLMPKKKENKTPLYKVFGFENEDDYILCIKSSDITEEEFQKYFSAEAWKKGSKWLGNGFFGGIRYAPKDAGIPPIKNVDKIFKMTWPEFKKEGIRNSMETGAFFSDWLKEN